MDTKDDNKRNPDKSSAVPKKDIVQTYAMVGGCLCFVAYIALSYSNPDLGLPGGFIGGAIAGGIGGGIGAAIGMALQKKD